ncbi:MAG: hypothetical protein Q4A21_03085 [bacterium]|nr:hypothetical protein [bacterium]
MDKKKLKKRLKWLAGLKNWQLFILLCLVLAVVATAWRMNNTQMLRRLDAVIAADAALDEEKARENLLILKEFSARHMNANTGLISLVKIYEKDAQSEISRVSNLRQGENVHKKVSEICDPQFDARTRYSRPYFECWTRELEKLSPREGVDAQPKFRPKELYEYNFISPIWTPDLAGWMTLVAILIVLAIVFKMISTLILKFMLKKYQNS